MRSQGWRIILGGLGLTAWIALSGCAKEEKSGVKRWAAFPVPVYSDGALAASSLTEIGEAMAFWEAKAGRRLFDYRGTWDPATPAYTGAAHQPTSINANIIFELNPWAYSSGIAAQTVVVTSKNQIRGSMIMVNGSLHGCSGDCQNAWVGATSLRRVFTHEIGHFLGLDHSGDVNNIMYPQIQAGASVHDLRVDTASLSSLTN